VQDAADFSTPLRSARNDGARCSARNDGAIRNKQQLKNTIMKKFSFLFAMLTSVAASATVTVTPLSTDYAAKKVTFKVEWTNTPTAPYNNRVWIWIDFCPVNGVTP
jgi:hypothetical protein